jgi:hypothetical protein
MKKTVLVYGLVSGVLASGMMLAATRYILRKELGKADLIGYSSMVLVALLIFFGVRSYRRNVGAGKLSFRRGFLVGLGITLLSTACYLATFQLLYYVLEPGIEEKYAACMVERAHRSGSSPAEIGEREVQARRMVELLENPWTNIALTLIEPLPVGLVLATLSAAILRKR